jgi:hypothetical protein
MPKPCTASEYSLSHARVLGLLDTIYERMQDLPAPDAVPINWEHVGSMRKAQTHLTELLRLMDSLTMSPFTMLIDTEDGWTDIYFDELLRFDTQEQAYEAAAELGIEGFIVIPTEDLVNYDLVG